MSSPCLLSKFKQEVTRMAFRDEYVAYDDGDGVSDLCPCEFCENLFPFNELILHQSGCGFAEYEDTPPHLLAPSIVEANRTQNLPESPKVQNKFRSLVIAEETKMDANPPITNRNLDFPEVKNVQSLDELSTSELENMKFDIKEIKKPDVKKVEEKIQARHADFSFVNEVANQRQRYKEFEEKGLTLLSLVCENSQQLSEDHSEEEPVEDIPDIEDINNLSDDNCAETLEEFWHRAEAVIDSRRKAANGKHA